MSSSRTDRRTRAPQFLVGIIFSLLTLYAAQASAQLVGTKNIPGDYPDLASAIGDLNTVGVGAGGVTLNVVASNPQNAPAGGYAITTLTGSAANPIVIQGNNNTATASAALTVGALNDAIFKIIGTDFVTISGFQMLENPANTVTTAASNTMTEFGVALFYTTPTDGTQNITIQGNTIDLNRTYQNTFGIYANSTHTATAVTTSATATGPTGGASNLKIYGNTITDVNIGIVVVGPTAAADNNDGIDIGGSSAGTGNNINNFGTTGTFSAYANVSGTVNGVLVRNSKTVNVSFNTIASSNGGTTAGTLRGIYMPAFSNAPTGTYTNSFNNNNISLRSAVLAGTINGILIEATTGTATSALQINNNDFNTTGHTVAAATGAITFISNATATLSQQINGNTFTNMSVNTTGSVTFIVDGVVVPATGSQQVNNNSIVTAFGKTGAGGTVTFFSTNASSVNGATVSNSNNNVSNVTLTGATGFVGIANTDGASASSGPTKTINGNTISNIVGGTGTITPFSVNFSGPGSVVNNNTVSNINWGAATTGVLFGTSNQATLNATANAVGPIATTAGAVVGISTGAPTANFTGNTISSLSSSAAVSVTGFAVTAGTTVNVSKNKIYDVSGSNAGSTVNGVLVSAGTTIGVFNNLIGDLRAPAANAANAINGINLTSATATSNLNISYNTVYINATSSGATFGTSGLFHTASATGTTAALNLRNNAIVNVSTPAGTGLTVAYRRSAVALNNYGAASNNNDFFAGTPGASNLIFFDGTNSDQTLAAYKTRVATRDSNSLTENPPFTSTTGSSANFLHIANGTPTQLESTGAPIAGISDDFDGNARNASTPDVGGDEFNGVILDVTPPAIAYTPLGNTTLTANRVLPATISDISGVAGGANAPRIYFRKNAGTYFSTQCAGSAPSYSCTVDHGLVGGVVTGDTISYFVIAQDVPNNVGSNPSAGLVASDVNTVTTPPTTPNTYLITTGFPAAVNVGTGNPITSLTNSGGLFEAINAGVFTSNVVVTITSDLAAESGTVALNQISEEGVGGYTLTLQPDSATERLITGAVANGMIRLNGADRVTFDGRFGGTGRFLRFRNTNTANPTFVFGNDATANTIRSTFVESANTTATSGTIVFGTAGASLGNSNNSILDSDIRDRSDATGVPANAIFSSGTAGIPNALNSIVNCNVFNWTGAGVLVSATGAGDGWTIGGSNFFQTAARTTALTGISVQGGNAHVIQGNNIGGGAPGAGGAFLATNNLFRGIDLTVGTVAPTSVQGNTVKNIRSTSTAFTSSYGIFLQAGAANIGNVAGNTIGSADPNERYEINGDSYGIRVVSTSTVTVRNNTVNNMTTGPGVPTGEFYFGISAEGTGGTHTVQGNTVTNLTNGSTPDASFSTQTIGIFVSATGAQTVRNNTISNIVSSNATLVTALNNRVWGMILSGTGAGTVIERNSVSGLTASTATTGARADVITGIQLQTLANATLSNNMVSLSGGAASDRAIFGILDLNASGPTGNYYFNSVNVFGTATAANNTFAFNRNGVATVSLRNNVFANVRTGGTGFHVAMANSNATATGWSATASNYNIVWNATPAHVTQWLGSGAGNNQTLAGFQTASGGDANSLNVDPLFVSNTDLHIQPTSPAISAGTPFGGITIDFDGQPRNATTPTIGADEIPVGHLTITPPSVNFGNQTVGTTSPPSTVTLGNDGTASLDVTVLDTANPPFARSGGTCSPITPFSIPAGTSCTLQYTFSPTVAGPATQTLTVTANAPGSGTIGLSGNGEVLQSDLSITKTDGVGAVQTGSTVIYTVTASNAGPATATGATVLDTPPAELTGCSWTCANAGGGTCGSPAGGPTINDTVNLPMGGSVTYTLTCTVVSVTSSTSLVNSASVVAPPLYTDPDSSNNSATDTDNLLRRVDLSVLKTDGAATEVPGTPVSYTITVGNAGPNGATGTVTDGFGASFTGCNWTCAATNGTCAASGSGNISDPVTIASGGQLVYTANCTVVPSATGTLVNAASAVIDNTYVDTNTGNNSSTDVDTLNAQGDFSITINDSRQFVQVGNTLNYVIVVGNTGPSAGTANVSDVLPSELNAGSWVCIPFAGASCSNGSGSTLSDAPTLPPGSQVGYVFSTTVANASNDDLITNGASIAAGAGITDTNAANDNASDTPADVVVIFKDGFEGTPLTLIDLVSTSDFAQAQLNVSRAWIDRAGMVPTVLFRGESNKSVLFSVELLRMNDDVALRVLTRDKQGVEERTAWQRVNLSNSMLDFAWQSAATVGSNGYLQLRVGGIPAAAVDHRWETDGLVRLRVPVDTDGVAAVGLTH